jgi:hypothetical protein
MEHANDSIERVLRDCLVVRDVRIQVAWLIFTLKYHETARVSRKVSRVMLKASQSFHEVSSTVSLH